MKLRIFISSVQKEFAEERRMLADYIRAQVGPKSGPKLGVAVALSQGTKSRH